MMNPARRSPIRTRRTKTDDLYFKVSYNGQTYDFCVEYYLCGSDTDVYKALNR